eukprot:CAMPEP_0196143570 /NCGR_PEP_ID=MMETSP0910-20130528/13599_1 /TAXON_ID=49265 /ORGANISM="Thalassiosira rotula, Strain GSO102" /LENGTH=363 /DNA_ID=CAMNT_0041405047 /DNA_START=74 /DNA_END=1165 /DNA_ORIENTATION=-
MMYAPTFGACVQQGVARCVLSPQDCSQLEVYRPAKSLGASCSLPTDIDTGRCTGSDDQFKCAATKDSCYLPLEFDSSGGTGDKDPLYSQSLLTCNLQYGEGSDGYSLFPMCQEKPTAGYLTTASRCVLFKEECRQSTEHLILASEEKEYNLCKCHDVPVGVCYPPALGVEEITHENSYCAVGAWDCRDDHISFLSGQTALTLPNIKCRLCEDAGLNPVEPVTGKMSTTNEWDPTSSTTPAGSQTSAKTINSAPPSPGNAPYESQPSTATNKATPTPPRVEPLPESSAEAFAEDLVKKPQQILSLVALVLGAVIGVFLMSLGVSAAYKRTKKTNHMETSAITFKGQQGEQSRNLELGVTNAYDA